MKIRGLILAAALMFVVTLGFVPGVETKMTVHAADSSGVCSSCGNIAWELEGTTLTIFKAEGASSGDMCDECRRVFPDTVAKVIVREGITSIGYGAFAMRTSSWGKCDLKEVELPNSLTKIEERAFDSCYKLINITIPENVKSIGIRAFAGCSNLKGIKISENIESFGASAFLDCRGLAGTIYLNASNMDRNVFSGCTGITNVVISEDMKSIPTYTFAGCTGLKSVIIPENILNIEDQAFINCEEITSAVVPCRLKEQVANRDVFTSNPTIIYTHFTSTCIANDTTDTITATCFCGEKTYTATLKEPTKTAYTGKTIVAICTNNIPGFTPVIKYSGSNLVNDKPVNAGTYTATLTYDDTTSVSLKYTIKLAPAPAKPHTITNVVSGVHVYWPATDGVSKYGLWRSENGLNGTYKWIANPTVAHFTDTKVESGKTYYYKVTTLDTTTNVHSEKSAAIGTIYVATPDITLRVNRAAGIGLGWDKIPGATGYAIYRKPYDGNEDWVRVTTITNPNTLKWDDTSVKTANGTVYRYTIRALAGSNRTILSGCRATGRTMVRLTSRDLNSAVKTGTTSIKCTWGTTTQATGYEVRFMVGNTVYKTYTIGNYNTGTKTFTGLKAGRTYKIQVRTYKKVEGVGSFYSAWSTAKTVSL